MKKKDLEVREEESGQGGGLKKRGKKKRKACFIFKGFTLR